MAFDRRENARKHTPQKFSSGIVLFAAPVFENSWKDFDEALNQHALSTMKKGEPLQVPVS